MQTSTKKTTFFNTLNTIYQHGGFSRFWKGSMIIGTASVPAHSLYFSIYEVCKIKFGVNNSVTINTFNKLIIGFPIRRLCNDWSRGNTIS